MSVVCCCCVSDAGQSGGGHSLPGGRFPQGGGQGGEMGCVEIEGAEGGGGVQVGDRWAAEGR